MGNVQSLLIAFERFVGLPWNEGVAGSQKVWFCVYDPRDERRLLMELTNFEIATTTAGHGWAHYDLSNIFGEWLATHEYRGNYFADPAFLDSALEDFATALADTLGNYLDSADRNTLVVITGAGSLFGLTSVSSMVEAVASRIKGRLAVFFPGHRLENNYRLLDARDGWNYLAIPIEGEVPQL